MDAKRKVKDELLKKVEGLVDDIEYYKNKNIGYKKLISDNEILIAELEEEFRSLKDL